MKNEIKCRKIRKVDLGKSRIILGIEAVENLKLKEGENQVVITIYENKVVITKKK